MNTRILLSGLLSLSAFTAMAQVPAASTDVLLQGFSWNSQTTNSWLQLTAEAAELGQHFNGIWLPPSAEAEGGNTVGGNNVGYHPRTWNNQNSCWGTAADLKTLIAALHTNHVKVIADIVVNHRAGYTAWANFSKDDFGTFGTYQLTAANVCSSDEVNTAAGAGAERGSATGAPDTGENWQYARDLDMKSPLVQSDIKAYLQWLKAEYGYDGFRYDFVKGYGAEYVGMFNDASSPYLSVGEYFDGSYDKVWQWIQGTGYKSMAFDFPAKYNIFNEGLAKGDYGKMAWVEQGYDNKRRPAGLIHHRQSNKYAVTFVDNHDTYRTDDPGNQSRYNGPVDQAYAVLLSSAGIPMVLYPHWTQYKTPIGEQIRCRKVAGVNSETLVEVTQSASYYESRAAGTNGTLICRVGAAAPTTVPEGYFLAASGNQWRYFLPLALQDELTGIETVTDVAPHTAISASAGTIRIAQNVSAPVAVVALDGRVLYRNTTTSAAVSVPTGVYIVKAGSMVKKINVE